MTYKVVLFDLDGTLLDTLEDLSAAVNHAMQLRGLPEHTLDEYRTMVGHGVRNLVTKALPEGMQGDEDLIDRALADFKAYYTAHIDVHTHPYPGMQELVERLHGMGVRLAVASNKFQEGTEYLARKFFPGIPFAAVLGNRPGFPLKPEPEIVGEVLHRTGARPEDTVLVGDSPTDMKTAANGGISAIAVTWGYRHMKGTPGLTTVDTPEELLATLTAPRYCQCCGMPLTDDTLLGREADGTLNRDYCKWCYIDGRFAYTSKDTLLDFLVRHMPNPNKQSDADRKLFFDAYLSTLKHWK